MKSRFYYFKIAFLPIGFGLFAGLFIYNLLENFMDGNKPVLEIFVKSLLVGFITALIMGIINMFTKMDFPKRQN